MKDPLVRVIVWAGALLLVWVFAFTLTVVSQNARYIVDLQRRVGQLEQQVIRLESERR